MGEHLYLIFNRNYRRPTETSSRDGQREAGAGEEEQQTRR